MKFLGISDAGFRRLSKDIADRGLDPDYGEGGDLEEVQQRFNIQGGGIEWTSEGWVCHGSLYLHGLHLTRLPLVKSVVNDFSCHQNLLKSLEGAPSYVEGSFTCGYNPLTSLEGAPEEVHEDFICSGCELVSLEGAPKSVGGFFFCNDNQLVSLEGAPSFVGGDFLCVENPGGFTEEDVNAVCGVGGQIGVGNYKEEFDEDEYYR